MSQRVFSLLGLIAGVALLGPAPAPARAAATCVPAAVGVPALSGPPQWWDTSTGTPKNWTGLDDPRWRGSFSQTYGAGTTEQAAFRALYDGASPPKRLFLSWNGEVVPALTLDVGNQLYVGFSPGFQRGGQNFDVLISITLHSAQTSPAAQDGPVVNLNNYTAKVLSSPQGTNTWGPEANPPPWIAQFTGVWAASAPNLWAVQTVIPIASTGLNDGLNLASGATFKMWYEFRVSTPAGQTPFVPYTFPLNNPITTQGGLDKYPATTTWADVQLGGTCTTGGVSLSVTEIGTLNNPSSQINLTSPNTFFAKPLNATGGVIDPTMNQLAATFRIANWGTQPDWNNVPDPTKTLWSLVPNGDHVPCNSSTANNTEADIHFSWTLSATDQAAFTGPGATKRPHQCMLVQLSGPGLTFLNNSVVRNMDFVPASKFQRECEVSVKGLKGIGGANRKVYLYVETRNMPETVTGPTPGTGRSTEPSTGRVPPTQRGPTDRGTTGRATGRQPPPPEPTGRDGPPIILRDLRLPRGDMRAARSTSRALAVAPGEGGGPLVPPDPTADMPTYIVHVYHETGRTVSVDGTEHPVLEPQTSFGYFVQHDGPLMGWRHALDGATQIAPDFYVIDVPDDGTATVTTVIEALEPGDHGGDGDHGGKVAWWVWLIVAGVALLLLLLIVKALSRRGPAAP